MIPTTCDRIPGFWRWNSLSNDSWWFQPLWKICSSDWIISPEIGFKKWQKIFELPPPSFFTNLDFPESTSANYSTFRGEDIHHFESSASSLAASKDQSRAGTWVVMDHKKQCWETLVIKRSNKTFTYLEMHLYDMHSNPFQLYHDINCIIWTSKE